MVQRHCGLASRITVASQPSEIHQSLWTVFIPQVTMPEFEFRSKKYEGEDWRSIYTDIISDLRREELTAFAPEARVAQADKPVPPTPHGPPLAFFPLMKLPLELRTMVYKMHFAQAAEFTYFPSSLSLRGTCLSTLRLRGFQRRRTRASPVDSLQGPLSRSHAALFSNHEVHFQQSRCLGEFPQCNRTFSPAACYQRQSEQPQIRF